MTLDPPHLDNHMKNTIIIGTPLLTTSFILRLAHLPVPGALA